MSKSLCWRKSTAHPITPIYKGRIPPMTIFQAIVLGIIQGLTEFLPISSSAHLVIVPYLLNWKIAPEAVFVFDVLVQIGTLTAVIFYFWHDLVSIASAWMGSVWHKKPFANPQARMGWYLIIATLPAGVFGILLKDLVEAAFNNPFVTAMFLFVTAAFLISAERIGVHDRSFTQIQWKDALWIGVFQIFALFPGISRSGSTITGGMLRKLDRPAAARFSFLMSVPILLAAGLVAILDLFRMDHFASQTPMLLAGFITSAGVGYLSIRWLLSYVTRKPLYSFSVYCMIFGGITLVVHLIR